jgi:thiamine pyrophosphate-dependent acetolactate synthase large subunit-like protein
MGAAAMVGLGLAIARPDRRVLVVTGDGEMLMGIGSLATIATRRPDNLAIAVIDNERYGETGMQTTHTAAGVDLAGMARAAGFPVAATIARESELNGVNELLRRAAGPALVVIKVDAARDPFVLPPRDGVLLKHRFRAALLGEAAAS